MISLPPVALKLLQLPLRPLQQWLESIEIQDPETARLLCKVIPAQCPFERTIQLFQGLALHIPPLCKLNPFYDQLTLLRFKSLVYLSELETMGG